MCWVLLLLLKAVAVGAALLAALLSVGALNGRTDRRRE